MKKLSIEYVKSYFLNDGYTPLFDEYISNKIPLKVMCPKGHICYIKFNSFKDNGNRCFRCRYLGKNNPFYGKTHSDESKDKMSRSLTGKFCGKDNPFYGKKHSDWSRGKISKELTGKFCGENHPNWKGGISCEPYCPAWSDKEYKGSIKERDNYMCQNPYCYRGGSKLHVHHIDYDKKNCGPDNLITVCGSCNTRANKDREWHTAWYQTIMNHKYGYVYKSGDCCGV